MDDKDKKIKELQEEVMNQKVVLKSERLLTAEIKAELEKSKLHVTSLQEINEDYSNKIAKYKVIMKKFNEINGLIRDLKIFF